MIHSAEVRIGGERRFASNDGDGVDVNSGFVRMEDAWYWATCDEHVDLLLVEGEPTAER